MELKTQVNSKSPNGLPFGKADWPPRTFARKPARRVSA